MTNQPRLPKTNLLDVPVQPGNSKNHSTPSGVRTPYENVIRLCSLAHELEQTNLSDSSSSSSSSIDLSKYSFPNENKPKTDYTYASTYTDYLKEPKSILDENQVEMPNLCRRGRKSPNTSLNSGSSSGLLGADTMNASVLERFVETAAKARDKLVARVNFLEYFKTFPKNASSMTVNGDESLLVGNVILTRNKKSRKSGSCLLCFPCFFFSISLASNVVRSQ